jgi:hypothetical protein
MGRIPRAKLVEPGRGLAQWAAGRDRPARPGLAMHWHAEPAAFDAALCQLRLACQWVT